MYGILTKLSLFYLFPKGKGNWIVLALLGLYILNICMITIYKPRICLTIMVSDLSDCYFYAFILGAEHPYEEDNC